MGYYSLLKKIRQAVKLLFIVNEVVGRLFFADAYEEDAFFSTIVIELTYLALPAFRKPQFSGFPFKCQSAI
jgi:hypothetical protein